MMSVELQTKLTAVTTDASGSWGSGHGAFPISQWFSLKYCAPACMSVLRDISLTTQGYILIYCTRENFDGKNFWLVKAIGEEKTIN